MRWRRRLKDGWKPNYQTKPRPCLHPDIQVTGGITRCAVCGERLYFIQENPKEGTTAWAT